MFVLSLSHTHIGSEEQILRELLNVPWQTDDFWPCETTTPEAMACNGSCNLPHGELPCKNAMPYLHLMRKYGSPIDVTKHVLLLHRPDTKAEAAQPGMTYSEASLMNYKMIQTFTPQQHREVDALVFLDWVPPMRPTAEQLKKVSKFEAQLWQQQEIGYQLCQLPHWLQRKIIAKYDEIRAENEYDEQELWEDKRLCTMGFSRLHM